MENQVIVGVDVGGTAIKMALLSTEGEILTKLEEPTPVAEGEDKVIEKIARMITDILKNANVSNEQVAGVGLGVPGPVDTTTGVVLQAVNLHWTSTPLKEKLERLTGLLVKVENDANCAALGEMWRGAGLGAKNMIMVTLGTGVGGGVILNGKVISGINGVGGEIGHITLNPQGGPPCNCGKTGCLETYASATAIIREGTRLAESGRSPLLADALSKHGQLRAKDVFDAAHAGDEAAIAVIDEAAFYLGLALANLVNVLDPAKIVIGGGVSAAGDFLFSRIRQSFVRFLTFSFLADTCQIVPATLGNDAGVIGAGKLIHEHIAS
ncbi:ROK family glucokinase [Brevibacillus sp. SYP-B805]|uniref:ROK family glucokinase n=1 Tax=Brevibacillus sp. SYP-B805 TaxID=1578199 RepID=UPI0013E9D48D|nr:ROK family glucokinase [Brevibacillus sp. SYP-B805]NGQ96592.1 ROK family glucokinase [Brevibacillus sp. SYP-B805]